PGSICPFGKIQSRGFFLAVTARITADPSWIRNAIAPASATFCIGSSGSVAPRCDQCFPPIGPAELQSLKETRRMKRRNSLALTAAAPALSAAPAMSLGKIPTRKAGKVEIAFKSPGPQPNGLQATKDGLWIIDQGAGSKAYLVSYEDGKVLRSFETETDRSSGITFDGEALWIGSTYSREIVRVDAMTGKALERHFTPGAGVIYQMLGDPKGRSSPLAATRPPRPERAKKGDTRQV